MSTVEISDGSVRRATDGSLRRASIIAGIGLILMAVLAIFGNFVVLENLVTQGDATQTANDIMNSEGMFRFGIVSLFVVIVLDVVVAWALFTVFEPVSRSLSLLTAWFRVVYAGVFLIAVSELVGVLNLLNNAEALSGFSTEQIHAQALLRINAFYDIWDRGVRYLMYIMTIRDFDSCNLPFPCTQLLKGCLNKDIAYLCPNLRG